MVSFFYLALWLQCTARVYSIITNINRMRRGLHFLLFFLSIGIVYAQQPMSVKMKKPVICYASGINSHSYVPPPKEYLNRRAAQVQTATIEVTFSAGFPINAQTAFNRAVDIWETLIIPRFP